LGDAIEKIAKALSGKGPHVVFTGAGISTESGISDYRSKGGIWNRFQPIYFDEFMSSKSARIEYWRRKTELYIELARSRPNAAHLAIARWYESGFIEAVITQNIDGLHQEAGMPDDSVIELHGNTRRIRCMHCGAVSALEDARQRIAEGDTAPECTCGGYLKPDTNSFGQALPEYELGRAVSLSKHCRSFIVVGSTLIVQPASLLPGYARRADAFLAIINLSETPYDNDCDVLIRERAGVVLPQITARLGL